MSLVGHYVLTYPRVNLNLPLTYPTLDFDVFKPVGIGFCL